MPYRNRRSTPRLLVAGKVKVYRSGAVRITLADGSVMWADRKDFV